jgi:hypothetical protein
MMVMGENMYEEGMKERRTERNGDEKDCKTNRKIYTGVSNKGRGEE